MPGLLFVNLILAPLVMLILSPVMIPVIGWRMMSALFEFLRSGITIEELIQRIVEIFPEIVEAIQGWFVNF